MNQPPPHGPPRETHALEATAGSCQSHDHVFTSMLTPLPMPVSLPFWTVGAFSVTREILRVRIGPPHYVETDGLRTFGGEEDWWSFTNGKGLRLLILLQVPYEQAVVLADPPDCLQAESALAQAISDSKYDRFEPVPWTG